MGCKLKITIKGLALEARNRAVRSVGFWIAYGSMGVLEKNFQKLWKILEFFWHGCCHDAVGGVFCDATNQELFKALAPNVATGQAPVWTAKSGRHGNIL